MSWSIDLRQPVKGMMPITEAQAEELSAKVHKRTIDRLADLKLSDDPQEKRLE